MKTTGSERARWTACGAAIWIGCALGCRGAAEHGGAEQGAAARVAPGAASSEAKPSLDRLQPDVGEPLTLEAALDLARAGHAELAESRARIEGAKGALRAAGRWPDPSLVVVAETLPLGGDGVDPNYLAGLEQPIPLGGRLGAADRAAAARLAELREELSARERAVLGRVRGAFATALVAQEVEAARERTAADAARAVELAQLRVRVGDVAADELAQARLLSMRAQSEARAARASARAALAGLRAAIGGGEPSDLEERGLSGEVEAVAGLPELSELAAALAASPALRALEAEAERWRRELELARAERVPDLDLSVLYRRVEGVDENALDVGLRLPLPIFRRGEGRIATLEAESRAAAARKVRAAGELGRAIAAAHAELERALADERDLRELVLPEMDAIVKRAEARFAAGDAGLPELLAARIAAADRRVARLDALRDAHAAWSDIESLVDLR